MNAKSVLITGANRGIGLEFVRQLVKSSTPPQVLFATCRNPENAVDLQSLAEKNPSVKVMKLDVTNDHDVHSAVENAHNQLGGNTGLNLLINNSAINTGGYTLDNQTRQKLQAHFDCNVTSPLLLSQAFVPLLKKAASHSTEKGMSCNRAAIINITSLMGSVADNSGGAAYAYRASKAALNMVGKSLSVDLKNDGILVALLHPGWVKTDMGGERASTDKETSVAGMLTVMAGLTEDKTGSFFNFNGKELPW